MNAFLALSALFTWVSGLSLMFATKAFYAPFGIEVTDTIALVAQAEGAVLLGVGVINWLARRMDRYGQTAVLAGNLLAQALSLVVIARAGLTGVVAGAVPGVVLHAALGSACAYFLLRARRSETASLPAR